MVDKNYLTQRFNYFVQKMGMSQWNLRLEFVEHDWKSTANVRVVKDGAILYLNIFNPECENLEQVMFRELCRIKQCKFDG